MTYALEDIEQGYCRIEDGPVYECYFPKTRQYWNGWAMPVGLTPDSLVDFFEAALAGDKTEQDYDLCFELLTSLRRNYFTSQFWDGEADNCELNLYAVGDGLIWTECDEEGEGK